jgi:hypothetical protein
VKNQDSKKFEELRSLGFDSFILAPIALVSLKNTITIFFSNDRKTKQNKKPGVAYSLMSLIVLASRFIYERTFCSLMNILKLYFNPSLQHF